MKKKLKVKALIRTVDNLLEDTIKIGDYESAAKERKRLVDLNRAEALARQAAEKARRQQKDELAATLEEKADEIKDLIKNYNVDTIDPEETNGELDSETAEKEEENSQNDSESNTKDSQNTSDDEDAEESEDNTDGMDDDESTDSKDKENSNGSDDNIDNDVDNSTKNNSNSEAGNETAGKQPQEEPQEGSDEEDESSSNEQSDSSEEDEGSSSENNQESNEDTSEESEEQDSEESEDGDSENEGNEDDDSEEKPSNKQPVADPFADEEDIPNSLGGLGAQEAREADIEDIIKQLKGLKAESKKGAVTALKDLLTASTNANESFNKNLTEAARKIKGVREMTDDEFGDYLNSIYDLIDQVEAPDYVDDLASRKAKIKDWSSSPLTAQELAAEDNVEIKKDFQKKKANERETQKYKNIKTIDDFKLNFYKAVKFQVDMVRQEYQSYDEINPEYESEDAIMKADIIKDLPDEAIPIIDIYFDVSQSWDASDIEIGKRAVATVKEFEDQGEIKINLFYFANEIGSTIVEAQRRGTGTTAWPKILQNIKATKATNVVIMTDDDIQYLGDDYNKWAHQYSAKYGPTCRVTGCVWFLWKNGLASPDCVKKLIGRQGNYQYAFKN